MGPRLQEAAGGEAAADWVKPETLTRVWLRSGGGGLREGPTRALPAFFPIRSDYFRSHTFRGA